MRRFTIYATEAKEINEYHLSLIIHALFLVAISISMLFKAAPVKKTNIVPVTLVAQIEKPRAGAVAPVAKEIGSKKTEGNTNKVVSKPKQTAPIKAVKPKSDAKPVKKAVSKPTTNPTTAKSTVVAKKQTAKAEAKKAVTPSTAVTPIVAIKPAQTNLPSVIDVSTVSNAPVKPSHNVPLFEEVSDISTGIGNPSPMLDEMSGPGMMSDDSMLMPESMMDDSLMFAAPTDDSTPVTGTADGSEGNGVVQIGDIEAFGGSNENFIAPTIITKVQPDYPDWARKQGVHGNAVYRVLIQPSGTVGDVVTMSSTIDPKLAIDGAQALRRWVFTPVLNNGVPQETWVKISVAYELN